MAVLIPIDATSWTLIRGAAAGNPADREVFAERYGPVLRAYLAARWRLPPDHERIDDCTQEIFVQCFKDEGALQRAEPDHSGGFRGFLYGVAKNVSAMHERSRRQRSSREVQPHVTFDLDSHAADETTLSGVFDRAWAVMVTREARLLMSRRAGNERWVQVLGMRFQDKLPPREIAARLGIEVNRVYELLRKAKHEYRVALIEVMATYNPEADERELEQRCIELLSVL